jgi:hypothetical protein
VGKKGEECRRRGKKEGEVKKESEEGGKTEEGVGRGVGEEAVRKRK